MKKIWLYGLTFVGGLVVGGASAGTFVAWHWQRNFADGYVAELADQANVAREIYSGKSLELAGRIRSNLPVFVHAIETEFRGAEGKQWAYWIVDDVYRVSGESPPPEVRSILAALPPRPQCARPRGSRTNSGAPR